MERYVTVSRALAGCDEVLHGALRLSWRPVQTAEARRFEFAAAPMVNGCRSPYIGLEFLGHVQQVHACRSTQDGDSSDPGHWRFRFHRIASRPGVHFSWT